MFAENLKTLRKQKGFTQEELAIRLNVVRQTISKWEKGLSVPDAELLIRLSEIFEVSVSELLGSKIENEENVDVIAEQLARLNEQLALTNCNLNKFMNVAKEVLLVLLVVLLVVSIYDKWCDIWYEFGNNLYHVING